MKKTILTLAAVATMAASAPLLAQQKAPETATPAPSAPATPAPATATTKPVNIPKGVFPKGQQVDQYSAKERLIGAKVFNKAGELIGDIEDLIMASGTHTIDGVIVGVGGMLGVGEKKIGVAYKALTFSSKDGKRVITLDTSKEVLAVLQPYKYAEPPKTALQRATEATKEATKKAGEATKAAVEKAKEAVKSKTETKPAQ